MAEIKKKSISSRFRRGNMHGIPSPFGQSWRRFEKRKPSSTKYKGPFQGKIILKEVGDKYMTHFKKPPMIGALKTCYVVENQEDYDNLNAKIQEMIEDQNLLVSAGKVEEANKLYDLVNEYQIKLQNLKPALIKGKFRVLSYRKGPGVFITLLKPV